jgi:hypothetical protein
MSNAMGARGALKLELECVFVFRLEDPEPDGRSSSSRGIPAFACARGPLKRPMNRSSNDFATPEAARSFSSKGANSNASDKSMSKLRSRVISPGLNVN